MKTKKLIFIMIMALFAISVLAASPNTASIANPESTSLQVSHRTVLMKTSSLAHEHVNISADYEIVVGWVTEPPVVGVFNGVLIEINMFTNGGANTTPVIGAENNLTVYIINGGLQTDPSNLNPIDESPGSYSVPLLPTLTGEYSVNITGTLGTTSVNEKLALDEVNPASNVVFPYVDVNAAQDSSISSLNDQINGLNSLIYLLSGVLFITLIVAVVSVVFSYSAMNKNKKS